MLNEFKPALLFVAKFLAIYFVGNILYGLFIESYLLADPITEWVTEQSVVLLNVMGAGVETFRNDALPKVHILLDNRAVLSVYEGCNGLNVMIIFLAFLVAYSGTLKSYLWFVPLGIFTIHMANLGRIVMLYYVAEFYPNYMYFTHKYLFTAVIYVFVLALWYWWATKIVK